MANKQFRAINEERIEEKYRLLVGFCLICLVGMAAFLFFSKIITIYFSKSYPDNSFLFSPSDRFMDFFNIQFMIGQWAPYTAGGFSYPPFCAVLVYFFTCFSNLLSMSPFAESKSAFGLLIFGIYMVTFCVLIFSSVFFTLKRFFRNHSFIQIFILSICLIFTCSPFIFLIDRGNILIIVVALIGAGLTIYKNKPMASAFLIATAACIKLYPVLFILIFLKDKKFKEVLYASVYAIAITFLPLFTFQGGFIVNFNAFIQSLFGFVSDYLNSSQTLLYHNSISSLVAYVSNMFIQNQDQLLNVNAMSSKYGLILLLVTLPAVIFEKKLWKNALILSTLMIFTPTISYEYTLSLLIPCALLFFTAKEPIKHSIIYMFFFAFLWIPKDYVYFSKVNVYYGLPISTFFNSLFILLFLVFINFEWWVRAMKAIGTGIHYCITRLFNHKKQRI